MRARIPASPRNSVARPGPVVLKARHATGALTSSTRRFTAASGVSVMRSPVLRSLTSISPLLRPFGPTISWNGRPIRSMVANLAPARSSVSS